MTRTAKVLKLFVDFCRNTHKLELYPFQLELAEKVINAVITGSGEDFYAQISRQSGKTEVIVCLMEFLMIVTPKITGSPFRVGIFAPQKEQTKTDFDRLKTNLEQSYRDGFQTVVDPRESNSVTLQLSNGSYCYTFPLTETSHPESKTIDFAIYEEANKIKDKEKKDKADPMRTSTNAPSLSVGVGGYQHNYFKRGCDSGVNLVKADYKAVVEQKQQAYEKDKNEWHLNYGKFIDRVLQETPLDDESFRTQYGLEFIVGGGSFIRADELRVLKGDFGQELKHDHGVFFGLDTAKFPDRTVLTVKCPKCKRILSWLRLQGDNYQDQFDIICRRLSGYKEVIYGAIDSTGQGDFMPDLFENSTDYDVLRVKFSLQSKDAMSKNLLAQIRNKATMYPGVDCPELREFEREMLDLEREFKGEFMSVHAPEDGKSHDDYFASWMLAEWAHHHFEDNQPDVHVFEGPKVTGKAPKGKFLVDPWAAIDDDEDF